MINFCLCNHDKFMFCYGMCLCWVSHAFIYMSHTFIYKSFCWYVGWSGVDLRKTKALQCDIEGVRFIFSDTFTVDLAWTYKLQLISFVSLAWTPWAPGPSLAQLHLHLVHGMHENIPIRIEAPGYASMFRALPLAEVSLDTISREWSCIDSTVFHDGIC